MDILSVSVVLLWLVSAVGYFWLLSFACKQSRMWGVAVFFLSPIAAIIFARKHWKVAKKPFLVYVTSFCLAIAMSIHMANSLMDVKLSKVTEQSKLAQENVKQNLPQNLSKAVLDHLDTRASDLKSISQQSDNEDEQKFIRLISEYAHYKKSGFTDRSRRYIMRNVRELLLLPGLNSGQRTRLLKIKEGLAGKKTEGVSVMAAASHKATDQTAALTPNKTVLDDASPPPLFLTEGLGLSREKKQGSSAFGKRTPVEIQVKPGQWETKRAVNRSPLKKISFRQAKHHIGSQITFINLSGTLQKCFLVGYSSAGLECEKRFESGTFSTQYHRSEVKSLSVFRN